MTPAVLGSRRLQGASLCIDCRRTVYDASLDVLQRGQNELLPAGCPFCGRVKDLYLAPLVQAREYQGVVSLPRPSNG